MLEIIYSVVVVFATTIGAIAGLGGGVIIKPVLDFVGKDPVSVISFYSSVAVFTMSIVAIVKQLKRKAKFDLEVVLYIAVGSMIGGLLGEVVFEKITSAYKDIVGPIQSLMLSLILVGLLIYSLNKEKIKSHELKNKIAILFTGLTLGMVSVFLGIGGGPLNIAILMYVFSYDTKQSVLLSIIIIFFSQLSKLAKVCLVSPVSGVDLYVLPFIMISGIIGGWIGTNLNHKLKEKQIDTLYNVTILLLIGLTMYNFINAL